MHKLQNSIDLFKYLRIKATIFRVLVAQEEDEIGA